MIKFLVMDVDGTLTDGKIYMGVDGEAFKAFDIKDGYALHTLLKEHGIIPVIITARKSPMVENRCKELGVTEIHQGVMNKMDCLKGILEKYSSADHQYDLSNVAYIGDDILDLQCMGPIAKAGGIAGCPSNAVIEVVSTCSFVAPHKGGEGAVRDLVEHIINVYHRSVNYEGLNERINKAIEYISKLDFANLGEGRYDVSEDFYYCVQKYDTYNVGERLFESHRKYVDIQWVVEGVERLYIDDINHLEPVEEYNADKDVIHYKENGCPSSLLLTKGCCAVLLPKDAHKPELFLEGERHIVKIVGKLLIRKNHLIPSFSE